MKKKKLSKEERRRLVGETLRHPETSESEARREELLRPSPYLGYDHAQIALHLLEREAYTIAEVELRRAIWLNPYDPTFKLHLALCLYRQKRLTEAKETLLSLGEQEKYKSEKEELLRLIGMKLQRG